MKPFINQNQWAICIALFLLITVSSCNLDSFNNNPSDPPPPDNPDITDANKYSAIIYPDEGGTIEFPLLIGQGKLEIPSGAIDEVTRISVYTQQYSFTNRFHFAFEPSGLQFNIPARITLPYSLDENGNIPFLQLYQMSELNDIIDRVTERHNWETLKNPQIDFDSQTISGDLNHFSTLYFFNGLQRAAYLVIDLPGKYLRPGDGIFVLTGGNNLKYDWVPGHVGMVRSVDPETGETKVIESTTGGGPLTNVDGVQINAMSEFKWGTHVFMGARRPAGQVFSDGERNGITNFAVVQLGKGYSIWGSPYSGSKFDTDWSCSGLVEASWDQVNRGVMGALDFLPSPVELFEATIPIDEIEVVVGEEIKIPVYPVVANPDVDFGLFGFTGYYDIGNSIKSKVTAINLPDDATWEEDPLHPCVARSVIWTPSPKDAGNTYTWTFKVNGTAPLDYLGDVDYDITQQLKVKVRGSHSYFKVRPASPTQQIRKYSVYEPIPQGAMVIEDDTGAHLIDSTTNAYPDRVVFTNQALTKFTEGWLDGGNSYYGAEIEITNFSFGGSAVSPNQSKTWLYWIDYRIPYFTGLE